MLMIPVLASMAASVMLSWDANNPAEKVTEYRVYEQQGTNWVKVGGTTNIFTTLTNVLPGVHTYAVTAANMWEESQKSVPVTSPPIPSQPGKVVMVVVGP